MNSLDFRTKMHVSNKDCFKDIKQCQTIDNLRKIIYDHVIHRKSELEYIDLTAFINPKVYDYTHLLQVISEDLKATGWKWKLSFGDTALFIFENEPPANCW